MTLPTSVAGLLSRGQWGRTDPNRPVAAVAGLPVLGARDRSDAVRVVARFPASAPGALWPGGGGVWPAAMPACLPRGGTMSDARIAMRPDFVRW